MQIILFTLLKISYNDLILSDLGSLNT